MPEIDDQSVAVPGHVSHVKDDRSQVVLMNTQTGEIFALTNSAAVIWDALATRGLPSAAASALTWRYGIPPERAAADVRAFVDRLMAANLLVAGGTGA